MNQTNELEMRLRSWAPRRPSAKLQQKLFSAPAPAAAPALEVPSFRLSWLAPVAGTLLLMCILFNQRTNPVITGATDPAPMLGVILSNQSAAYLPSSFKPEQNRLPADTFEWTNARNSTSSIRSLFLQKGK